MTYKQALAYPAKHDGWGHIETDSESMQAATAAGLARKYCLRPESIYKWALAMKVPLRNSIDVFFDNPDLLLVCVLNNWTINKGLAELEVATA